MAILIRKIEGETVALCAAKTKFKQGDIYIGDKAHHALTVKFTVDFESEDLMDNPPVDELIKGLMLKEEAKQ